MQTKIDRFLAGENLRVLDLFSGCGGLSLGFEKAGFDIVGAVELDHQAARSHAINFHRDHERFEEFAKSRDIEQTTPKGLFADLGIVGPVENQIDIIIGGPPCQAFTRVGRAKLREIKGDATAFLNDARSQLYKRYLEYVVELQPLAILMENVPDMLNYGGTNIAEFVCEDLESYGYKCSYSLLNTAFFGLPQMRERMFLIAVHESVGVEIKFPDPTHHIDLPRGYLGSRNVAIKHIDLEHPGHYRPIVLDPALPRALSAQDAISDLPVLTNHLNQIVKKSFMRLDIPMPYSSKPINPFQRQMREWPGHAHSDQLTAQVTRILPRDYPIFRAMRPGDQYPQALVIAEKLLQQKLQERGMVADIADLDYQQLKKQTIPPYDAGKFPNKWRKMEANQPARTLMAHLGKDTYSHIHYDSEQARTITVREAARLQSFPDSFHFSGAMNAAFRQIGNAVPPLMAEKLALTILNLLQIGTTCHMKLLEMN
ncbi:DNA cytosine methyltransferase [uncultured Pedobacter sp.]|uniref:DNA cytosine methyltransferase n=1 Tax=uncultured Pedobacter sp. TaxID=246139 RepID=UPI0025F0D297|nr:DNA cytosine methyltransferase [uncultured Pedobacter sp.]